MTTLYQYLKEEGWKITRKQLKEWDINPEKDVDDTTWRELATIANNLDITVSELVY